MNEARLLGLVAEAAEQSTAVPRALGEPLISDRICLPLDLWTQIVMEVVPMTMSHEPEETV